MRPGSRWTPRVALALLVPLIALLAGGVTAQDTAPVASEGPSWFDRLLSNPRAEVAQGLAELRRQGVDAGAPGRAALAFDEAARLAPEDPITQFDSGTGRLLAGQAAEALGPLQRAAEAASEDLAPTAYYNLGTAQLATQQYEDAIATFREALRRDSGNADAKFNLELALRAQKAQRQPPQPQPTPGGETPPQSSPQPQPEAGQDPAPPGPQPPPAAANPENPENPAQMTPQQVQALLQAIDQLERRNRRKQAVQRAERAPEREQDW